jgi:hypothetical protein
MRNRFGLIVALAAVLTLAVVTLAAEPAAACSCVGGTDDDMFARADAVFTGRLLDRNDPDWAAGGDPLAFSTLRFEVDGVYKGDVAVDQALVTVNQSSACGLPITHVGPYLVFARDADNGSDGLPIPDGMRYAGQCAGTRTLAEAPVPAAFGIAQEPTAPSDAGEPATAAPSLADTDPLPYFLGGLIAVVAVLGGAIVFGRRRTEGPAL